MSLLRPRCLQSLIFRRFSSNLALHKMTLRPLHYHLPLFPGFQLLDVAGPLDILNIRTQYPDTVGITLTVSAATLDPVSVKPVPPPNANWKFDIPASSINTACNQHMVPQCTFADVISALKAGKAFDGSGDIQPVDVLIIPGGPGTRLDRIYDEDATSGKGRFSNTKEVQDFIVEVAPYVRHSIITICTGSHVLSKTGLLDNRQATTNSARYEDVTRAPSAVNWKPNKRWLRDTLPKDAVSGSSLLPEVEIWSSAGITAGIDVMLEFISAHYGGIEIGMQTAKRMEYRWEREREASYFL